MRILRQHNYSKKEDIATSGAVGLSAGYLGRELGGSYYENSKLRKLINRRLNSPEVMLADSSKRDLYRWADSSLSKNAKNAGMIAGAAGGVMLANKLKSKKKDNKPEKK